MSSHLANSNNGWNYDQGRFFTNEEIDGDIFVSPELMKQIRENIMCPLVKVIPLTKQECMQRKKLKINPTHSKGNHKGNWAHYGL